MTTGETNILLVKVIDRIKKEDKFSLAYLLDAIYYNNNNLHTTYLEVYKKTELFEKLTTAIQEPKYLERLLKLNTYKDLQ